jgi:hypothetical protein
MQSTGLTDARVIWANQDAPRPKTPYITVNDRLALAAVGLDDEERWPQTTPGVVEHVGWRRMTVSINAYGPGAFGLLEGARDGLRQDVAIRQAIADAGMGVIDAGDPRDMAEVLDTRWEERAQMDSIFMVSSRSTEDVGWFDHAPYEGEFIVGGSPPSTIEISGELG